MKVSSAQSYPLAGAYARSERPQPATLSADTFVPQSSSSAEWTPPGGPPPRLSAPRVAEGLFTASLAASAAYFGGIHASLALGVGSQTATTMLHSTVQSIGRLGLAVGGSPGWGLPAAVGLMAVGSAALAYPVRWALEKTHN